MRIKSASRSRQHGAVATSPFLLERYGRSRAVCTASPSIYMERKMPSRCIPMPCARPLGCADALAPSPHNQPAGHRPRPRGGIPINVVFPRARKIQTAPPFPTDPSALWIGSKNRGRPKRHRLRAPSDLEKEAAQQKGYLPRPRDPTSLLFLGNSLRYTKHSQG